MKTSESIKEISKALVAAQKEMSNAVKDSKNPFFKSSYANLNSIREASIPVLNANGITVLQPTTIDKFVETILLHDSGEYMSSFTEIVCAKANDPQAYGSALSYARRYGLQSFICIGADDDDGEKAMDRTVTKTATVKAAPIVTVKNVDPVETTTETKTVTKKFGFANTKKPVATVDGKDAF